jgi:hypothetical protein
MVLQLHDRTEGVTVPLEVERLEDHKFRLVDNHLFDRRLTRGTEIEVRSMADGTYELVSVLKASELITRRFILSPKQTERDYLFLGAELEKRGGFWQLDFNRFLTINIPHEFPYDLDQVMADLNMVLQVDVEAHGTGSPYP